MNSNPSSPSSPSSQDSLPLSSSWKRLGLYVAVPVVAAAAIMLFQRGDDSTLRPSPSHVPNDSHRGKPRPLLGYVNVTISERLSVDSVVLEARITPPVDARRVCRIELVLPESCTLIDGHETEEQVQIDAPLVRTWTVRHGLTENLDAVVRVCTELGGATMAIEQPVRLHTAHGD